VQQNLTLVFALFWIIVKNVDQEQADSQLPTTGGDVGGGRDASKPIGSHHPRSSNDSPSCPCPPIRWPQGVGSIAPGLSGHAKSYRTHISGIEHIPTTSPQRYADPSPSPGHGNQAWIHEVGGPVSTGEGQRCPIRKVPTLRRMVPRDIQLLVAYQLAVRRSAQVLFRGCTKPTNTSRIRR
jgi:hypothetical protein